jgi:hypothetical protein
LDLDRHNLQLTPSVIGADPQPAWAAVRGRNTCWRRSRHHEADRSSPDSVAAGGLGEPDLQYTHSVRHRRLCQTEPEAECEAGLAAGPGQTGSHASNQRAPRDQPCDLRHRPRTFPLHPLRVSPRVRKASSHSHDDRHDWGLPTASSSNRRSGQATRLHPPPPRSRETTAPAGVHPVVRAGAWVPVCARLAWLPLKPPYLRTADLRRSQPLFRASPSPPAPEPWRRRRRWARGGCRPAGSWPARCAPPPRPAAPDSSPGPEPRSRSCGGRDAGGPAGADPLAGPVAGPFAAPPTG